ncbi:CinA family protein [Novosphingobium sp.]|uniref:CinA family protein n=1 Tax=Novosphingobium sp. TaxID=1874826 RepID=UPI00333ED126
MNSLLPDDLVVLAARVIAANKAIGRTVAVAESCTGGLVAAALTEIAGSSAVFDRGFVTYSNTAKVDMLGVSEDVIDCFGAVSVAVAWSMAQGALAHSTADIAVAITGVAGPDGGSAQKPVGTVVFACARRGADPEAQEAEMKFFAEAGTRAEVRRQAALVALELLLPSEAEAASAAPL